MLENRFIEQDTVVGKTVFPTKNYEMSVRDYVVRTDSDDGTMDLILPSVVEAAGRIYAIHHTNSSNNVTIKDQDDSEDWSDLTMAAADDNALLYSDGRKWWVLTQTDSS